ncbi:hypothetical protein [Streptomyces sioyaensis]|uniref:hypothetical protein n=1 Tax=Streptomyces sioyaensis TaxID=67364 RepID=UPI0037B9DEEC
MSAVAAVGQDVGVAGLTAWMSTLWRPASTWNEALLDCEGLTGDVDRLRLVHHPHPLR